VAKSATMIDVFNFRDSLPRRGDAHVCVANQCAAAEVVSLEDIERLFFGCIVYGDDDGTRYVGVWGKRAAAKFRRTLRESGATCVMHSGPPPARLMRIATQGGSARERWKLPPTLAEARR
jgi:hypothetical protein